MYLLCSYVHDTISDKSYASEKLHGVMEFVIIMEKLL